MNAQLAPVTAAPFDVLAIVTSAGGLDAMSAVLADLPLDLPAAVVVGQHLGVESALVDILTRRIQLPVDWVRDGERLQPGRVHVCPPHMRLEILPDRSCALTRFQHELLAEKPLDGLLGSLADSCGTRGLAVVLTGMGRDGAAGARVVRSAGGAVIVQNEASAAFPEMPRAAVEAGAADLVLPLAEIGKAIADVMAGGRFPQPRNEDEAREALFAGPGAARAALRAVDWPAGEAGGVRDWPQGLKAIVASMLHSRFPSCIFWGPEFVQVYNDAWISVLGSGHPEAAGRPARTTWSEIWAGQVAGYRSVLQTGEARFHEDQLFEVHRRGFTEEAYFTVSHSPVHDDHGCVRGVLTIASETTQRVLAARRQQALRGLASAAAGSESVAMACDKAAQVLAELPRDMPFVLLYVADAAGLRASLCSSTGLRAGSAHAPHTLDLLDAAAVWPIGRITRQNQPLMLTDLGGRLRGFHAGPWPESPSAALLLPLRVADAHVGGVMVAAISPRLPFDDACRDFFELVAQQVGSNMAEARLRESERERLQQLAELDRTRTEFFSNVSHEFRTPLTLILAPLEDLLASQETAASPLRRELEVASRNARRLLNLVDTLLDFSQIEAGRLRAQFRSTDLAALTQDIATLFRSAVERAGLAFVVDCPPLPQPVRVDAGMWEKIVSNLLSNALKFTFDGSISVRLRPLGQHVELTVSDTGVGIPQDELPYVFRRFHRVRGARARTEEGAGIGLALVHELVELHHGRVRVRSRPGEGTTFTVWLSAQAKLREAEDGPAPAGPAHARPVALQLAEEAARWSEPGHDATALPDDVVESMLGPANPALPVHVPGARILVADDNGDMRDYLARTLGAQWQVTLAGDGAEALSLARTLRPELVLADVMMPVLDGFGLLRELRSDNVLRGTPLVLVTARAHEDAAIEGLLAGADDYIAKPFSSRELVARVGAQLELARVRRQGERQVRELLSLMPVGVYACDTDGRFNYWNRRAVELWGREPDVEDRDWALTGAPRALAADGSWLEPQAAPMAAALRSGEAVPDRELTIVRADGARLELLVHIRPLYDDIRFVGAVCAFLDVTARKQAERGLQTLNEELEERVVQRTEDLRASEARFRALVTATSYVVYRMSADWSEMRQLEGQGFLADTGAPSRGWIDDYIHPEDQAAVRAAIQEAIRERKVFELEHRVRRADGTVGWTMSRAVPLLDDRGEIAEWFGAASDVTERRAGEEALRASEERYRALFNSMDEAYAVVEVMRGADGRWNDFLFVEVNPAFMQHTGMAYPVGRTATQILGTPNPRWAEVYGQVAETGEPVRWEETELTLGRTFDLNVFRLGGPGSRRVAVLFTNITRRRHAEEALRASETRLAGELAGMQRLYDLHARLANETDFQAGLQEIVAALWDLTDGGRGWLQLVSDDGERLEMAASHGDDADTASIELPGEDAMQAVGIVATRSTPITSRRGEAIGVLGTQFREPHRPRDEELRMIDLLAWTAADYVQHHRAEAALAADLRGTRLLSELGARLVGEREAQALYDDVLDAAIALAGADAGTVQMLDEATQELVMVAHRGFSAAMVRHFHRIDASSATTCGLALVNNRRAFVDYFGAGAEEDASLRLHAQEGLRCGQSTPLVARRGRIVGMVSTHSRRRGRLPEYVLHHLDLLARLAADLLESRHNAVLTGEGELP
jgi:PAS domain S-box-containing protein